jgi:hypothetical protein
MTLANPLRKVASKLMAKFGGVATIRRVQTGVYNAVSGTVTENTTDTPVRGVLEDVNQREVSGLVQSGDKRLTIAAADLLTPPTIADKVLVSGIVHQVISLKTVEQDNTAITYELILRA